MTQKLPHIAHFVHRYLFLTGSWIYSQLVNMKKYQPFVLTRALENRDQFPFEAVYCYTQRFKGNKLWQIGLRKGYEAVTHEQERYYTDVINSQKAFLLHAHFGTEGYYHLGVQKKTQLPLVTTFYGSDVSKLPQRRPMWRKRYRRLFEAGSVFLAEGPYMAQAIVDLGCPSHKVRVQHLGVDVRRIPFVPRVRPDARPVRILMVCSFREKKGIPYGIKAFARAYRKFPEMELRIIGGTKTLNEKLIMEQCKSIVLNEGIADRVAFLGYVAYNDYLRETETAHIFLAPSVKSADGDTEGGAPVAVIEAAAAGMPVIATRHCDIPNVVIDGKSGFLVPERDIPSLSKAILSLAASPETWPEMGKVGRERVETSFDVFKQIVRLERIYDEVLSGP
jgi:colanic acid/amylovoran biosynthesis glycosyltransferase